MAVEDDATQTILNSSKLVLTTVLYSLQYGQVPILSFVSSPVPETGKRCGEGEAEASRDRQLRRQGIKYSEVIK